MEEEVVFLLYHVRAFLHGDMPVGIHPLAVVAGVVVVAVTETVATDTAMVLAPRASLHRLLKLVGL